LIVPERSDVHCVQTRVVAEWLRHVRNARANTAARPLAFTE
jgi:hypothetical protein